VAIIGSVNFRLKFNGYLLPIALLAIVSANSRADETDALNYFVGQGVVFDSNLFRLPDGVHPSAVATGVADPPRSDTYFNTFAGIRFDKVYSRQHLRADFAVTHYAYRTYDYLDFTGVSGRAAWDWAVGDRWNGVLAYDQTQTPSNYATQTGFRTAYQLYQRATVDANYWWHPDWSAGAGLAKVRSNYNNSFNSFSDYDADIVDARITYRPSSGNQVRLLVRRTDGNYPNRVRTPTGFLAQPYTQDDYEAEANWGLDGHSRVYGRVGYANVSYGGGASGLRGFNGPTARLVYDWIPTGKTTVSLVLRRDIGPEPQENLNASFVATSAASIAVSWALSPKTSVRGFAEWRKRELGGDVVLVDGALRNPTYTRYYTFTGTWTPERSLFFNVTLGRETRTGNNLAYPNYDDNTVSANVQFSF
jgi:exopolysaccharide biosynthesis operon protein EpsL